MPIRPELRPLYPPYWRELSSHIRFESAQGRCQRCGRPHLARLRCLPDGRWFDDQAASARRRWIAGAVFPKESGARHQGSRSEDLRRRRRSQPNRFSAVCQEPSWLENIELLTEKAIKRKNDRQRIFSRLMTLPCLSKRTSPRTLDSPRRPAGNGSFREVGKRAGRTEIGSARSLY
jgi:hypothetical protein